MQEPVDRQTDTHKRTHTDALTQTHRHTHTDVHTQMGMHRHKHTDAFTQTHTDAHTQTGSPHPFCLHLSQRCRATEMMKGYYAQSWNYTLLCKKKQTLDQIVSVKENVTIVHKTMAF